jgi:hypothetical protein
MPCPKVKKRKLRTIMGKPARNRASISLGKSDQLAVLAPSLFLTRTALYRPGIFCCVKTYFPLLRPEGNAVDDAVPMHLLHRISTTSLRQSCVELVQYRFKR